MIKVVECPICLSSEVTRTSSIDDDGLAEFRCDECGEYFVTVAPQDEEEPNED